MKILIVARYFPPIVTGGARRPFLLAKALMNAGVAVRVLAPALPPDVEGAVVPHPMPSPAAGDARPAFSVKDHLRAHLLLPDPDIRWSLRAAKAARMMTDFKPDWVITTSPPESVHVAGRRIARAYGCRWAADFRDLWLDDPLIKARENPLRRFVETAMARRLLRKADLLLAPERSILAEASSFSAKTPVLHLPQPAPPLRRGGEQERQERATITVLHSGSFSLSHDKRDIDPALALFREAYARDPRFRLVLIGRLTDEEARKASETEGVDVRGLMSLEETWAAQAGADILLLVAAPAAAVPPGKLAEYRAAGKPIVCLGGGAWRKGLPGLEGGALEHLLALRTPEARADIARRQGEGALSPDEAARLLLDAMAAVENA